MTPRISLALEAIRTARQVLEMLPASDGRRVLLERAADYEREVNTWSIDPPTEEQRESMMKAILRLHVGATRLRRD